eukprot:scaffold170_cov72-Skeletonema_menzelii.AAC.1
MDGDWLGFWYERALFDQRYNNIMRERERRKNLSLSLLHPLFPSQRAPRAARAAERERDRGKQT